MSEVPLQVEGARLHLPDLAGEARPGAASIRDALVLTHNPKP